MSDFSQFSLRAELVQAVASCGYTTPTPIQSAVIPVMLTGADVTGQAQTGTGKTAAFALPILNNLVPGQVLPQALVLAPTRELALQVSKSMQTYAGETPLQVLAVYGGVAYDRQIRRLRKGVDVVVGTPGRILDLIRQGSLNLSQISFVVLDEADEMLSMGFIEDIEAILSETPATRQTALFSATLPSGVRRLAERYLRSPQAITIQTPHMTVTATEQRYYLVNEKDKLAALTRLFEVEPLTSALIFARTRAGTGELANELSQRGFPAEVLNGDLSQEMRERVLERFRNHQIKVLVATDVAARGLDIEDISHVINFDLSEDPEIYVHRIGRTGRAGRAGVALSLVTPQQKGRLRRVEAFTRQAITRAELPSETEIEDFREARLVNQVRVWLKRGRSRRERELAETLAAEGFDPLEIAAAAIKIARAEEKQRPIYPVSPVNERPAHHSERAPRRRNAAASHELGMVRLTLSKGRAHGIRPADVVSTIAFYGDIPGSSIGKIQIESRHTLVDVPEQFAGQVLAKTGALRIRKQPVTVELA